MTQLASNATIFNNKVITELRNKTKLFSVVIKGINFENIQEFKEELKQKGIVDMKEIKSAKSNSITINKVKLLCENQEIADELLTKGIYISFMKYRCEEFKQPIRLTSCYKCQKFGHIAKQCRSTKTICAKCGKDDHETDNNNRLICTAETKCCINCNQAHSSAYAGCPKKKEAIQSIKEAHNNRTQKTNNNFHTPQ